jgi:branched-chain amino acid aminotransferase
MPDKNLVYLNGNFIPEKEARINASGPGLLYGWGLFETMRAYKNKIIYLHEHLKRLKKSAHLACLKCPYSSIELKDIIHKTIEVNGLRDAYVRLTVWKAENGVDISVIVKKHKPYPVKKYERGIKVAVSSFRQNEESFLANLKTTGRLLYELSYLEAKKKGFEGSIILNNRGYVAEASRSNIFFVKDKALFTPALSCGCLEGITRRVVFDLAKKYNIKIYLGNFTLKDLYEADEVFFTNSLSGVVPVREVNKKIIGKGKCGRLTKFFTGKYNSLLR